jgi:hypothetical protein
VRPLRARADVDADHVVPDRRARAEGQTDAAVAGRHRTRRPRFEDPGPRLEGERGHVDDQLHRRPAAAGGLSGHRSAGRDARRRVEHRNERPAHFHAGQARRGGVVLDRHQAQRRGPDDAPGHAADAAGGTRVVDAVLRRAHVRVAADQAGDHRRDLLAHPIPHHPHHHVLARALTSEDAARRPCCRRRASASRRRRLPGAQAAREGTVPDAALKRDEVRRGRRDASPPCGGCERPEPARCGGQRRPSVPLARDLALGARSPLRLGLGHGRHAAGSSYRTREPSSVQALCQAADARRPLRSDRILRS